MLVEERNDLVNQFHTRAPFLLRLADDVGVAALVCLDCRMSYQLDELHNVSHSG